MTSRRALVTGATGFVGSHLVRRLLKAGWKVDGIIRPHSDLSLLPEGPVHLRLHTHSETADSMHAIVNEASPDVVFHLASLSLSEHQPSDVERLVRSNLLFGAQLVEAMTNAGVTSLVNTGTFWQHFRDEDYSPVNLYAATKQAFEAVLQYYVEARDMRVITLKLHDTYGPNDPRPKLLNLLRHTCKSGEPLAMSPGAQLIDLVHVGDVVNGYLIAADRVLFLEHGKKETWSISSGQPVTLRHLIEITESAWQCEIPIDWGRRAYRKREVMNPWIGKRLPGWSPAISLEKGLKEIKVG